MQALYIKTFQLLMPTFSARSRFSKKKVPLTPLFIQTGNDIDTSIIIYYRFNLNAKWIYSYFIFRVWMGVFVRDYCIQNLEKLFKMFFSTDYISKLTLLRSKKILAFFIF